MAEMFYYLDPDDNVVLLNDQQTRFLSGFAGLGIPGLEHIAERTPYFDGVQYKGLYAPPREVTVVLDFQAATLDGLIGDERALLAALNPYKDRDTPGRLRVVRAGATRDIRAMLVGFAETSEDRAGFSSRRALVFRCHDPFWFDPTQLEESYPLPATGGFSFPLSFPCSFASTAVSGYIYVTNDGDVDTYPTIRVYGPCDNPVVTNETSGKKVDITQSQDDGDYIEIDMEEATVEFYDQSAGTTTSILAALSADSEFWPLVRGPNTVKVEADAATGGSFVIYYYKRYWNA